MLEKFIQQVIRYRFYIVLATLVVIVAASSGIQYLQARTDYKSMFSADDPQLQALDNLQNSFTKSDSMFFVVTPKNRSRGGDMFTVQGLGVLADLTQAGWQLPYSSRVDSITNYQYSHANGDELIVESVLDADADITPERIAAVRQIALHEPQLLGKLISPRGDVAGVNVMMQVPENGTQVVSEIGQSSEALLREFKQRYPDYDFYLSGVVYVNYGFGVVIKDDMSTLMPIMMVVVIVVLMLLRSAAGTLVTVLTFIFSMVAAMGLMGWLGIYLTGPTSAAPTIILTVAIADCVHILVTYGFYLKQGQNRKDAMARSLHINFQPVLLTSLTTVIGFLTMNFSDSPPFNDLGNVVAIGVVTAFVLAVTFLPALVLMLPGKSRKAVRENTHTIEPFTEFVIRNQNRLFWGTGLVTLILVAFIPQNQLNNALIKVLAKGTEIRDSADFVSQNLSGLYSIEYGINGKAGEPVYNPGILRQVDQFAEWLRTQPEVVQVASVTDVFKRLNKNMHADDGSWYRLPESNELSAQYLLLYEMNLPFGLDLNNQIDFGKTATRVTVTLQDQDTKDMLRLEQKYSAWLEQNTPGLDFYAASPTLMFSHIGITTAKSAVISTTVALLTISLILIVAFKSVRLGILSAVPNLMPGALAFGVWGIVDGNVSLTLGVALGMTMGIVVDNTVHFLSKYLRARREEGWDAEQAVRYAFSNVGVALLVSNFVLIAGFVVLAQSDFQLNSTMGYFTALTFTLALVVDFLFLPPLLIKLDKGNAVL